MKTLAKASVYAVACMMCPPCVCCWPTQKMQREGSWEYEAVVEGEIRQKFMASVPEEIDRSRVKFMQVSLRLVISKHLGAWCCCVAH